MRIVTYGGACSLDGYIAGPNGTLDWMHFSNDVQRVMQEYFATIDTILMGRKTWAFAEASAGGGGGGDDAGDQGIETYVFSRTLKTLSNPRAHLVTEDAGEFVRSLKRKKGKGICVMGGGELARSLFAAGVIDEVGWNIHPVLLGGGVPMYPEGVTPVRLELRDSRVIDGGCLLANYRVKAPAARPTQRGR